MESNNLNYQRRCAVSKAWSKERIQILKSRGSRNWSPKEQQEIIATGKCHGYEGQHMLSVKSHPEHAGNEKNIQFLTHEEHFRAHGGNWKNDSNGRYNLKTKKIESFEGETPKINYRKLSDPLNDKAKKIANTKYEKSRNSAGKQSTEGKLAFHKRERFPVIKSNAIRVTDKKANSRSIFNSKANKSVNKSKGSSNTSYNRSTISQDKENGIGN